MMRSIKVVTFVCLMSMGNLSYASQNWQVLADKSKVSFLVQSTLHEVNGQARQLSGGFKEEKGLINGVITIDVAGLKTGNDTRDKNMYKMFDASQYTQIRFNFDGVNIADVLKSRDGQITFLGLMSIHHVTLPVSIISRGWMLGDSLVCEGNFIIHLKDYGLKPPSVMGIIRVKKDVHVEFRMVFTTKG